MALTIGVNRDEPKTLEEAARAFEALAIQQILKSSGAFQLGSAAGSAVHEGLFVEVLADELAKAGGLGIANLLTRELGSDSTRGGSNAPSPRGVELSLPAPVPRARPLQTEEADPTRLTGGVGAVTSAFGIRTDPFDGSLRRHRGIDVGAPEGTEIVAAAGGIVRRSGERGGYGNAIEIDHGNGVTTLYAHASEILVEEGTRVERGQVIGRVGSTGRATGAHLHFEVRKDDRPVNPTLALKAYRIGAE